MSEPITRLDGAVLTPVCVDDFPKIPQEKIEVFQNKIGQELMNKFNETINTQADRIYEIQSEINSVRKAQTDDMINRQAEAIASALKTYPSLFEEIVVALSSLCGNSAYNYSTLEDPLNDYVRDLLGMVLQIRDQTRQGKSGRKKTVERGKAGEIDIQIRNNGIPIGIYEGLRLESVNKPYIYDHISKATINYNPQGVKEIFVAAYVREQEYTFGSFWERFVECVKNYQASHSEYQIKWDEVEEDTGLSAVRSIHGVYKMNGVIHNVHVMAAKLLK